MRQLVMMPAVNESATVAQVIARVPRELDGITSVEVLVVDDGSTDDTLGPSEAIRPGVDITVDIEAAGFRVAARRKIPGQGPLSICWVTAYQRP